jgi:hypothetical protein
MVLVACGPKEPPETPPGDQVVVEDAEPEPEPEVSPEHQALIEQFEGLVKGLNDAIEAQDKEAFQAIFSKRSQELFFKVALLDMFIAGVQNVPPAEHILKQQKDFNVVYTVKDPDPEAMTGTLVGVLRDSGDEAQFPMGFVEEEGKLVIDYTEVLTERLDNLKVARMRALVVELNTAVDEASEEAYTAILTDSTVETCPDFFQVLKPQKKAPKIGSMLKKMQKAGVVIELDDIDPTKNTAVLKASKDKEEPKILEVTFILESGIIKVDATSGCAE